jgi:integrase
MALLSTAFYAGLRMGELHELRWADIDFPASIIVVRSGSSLGERSTTKGKRVRSVPVVDVLAHRLEMLSRRERFIDDDDYVFCDEVGARFDDNKARDDFYGALKAAGMGRRREKVDKHGEPQKPMVFHDLRHSFCTWAVNVFTVPEVKEFAGHRDITTTMKYVHVQTKAEHASKASEALRRMTGASRAEPAAA